MQARASGVVGARASTREVAASSRELFQPYDPEDSSYANKRQEDPDAPSWLPLARQRVLDIVHKAQESSACELEVRFGTINGSGAFVAGCSRTSFEEKLQSCLKSNVWSRPPERSRTVDGITRDNVVIRQDVESFSYAVNKTEIASLILPIVPVPGACCAKLSLKTESPCRVPDQQVGWVRVKDRTSFEYKGAFRYDYSQVWEERSLQSCLVTPPKYEIEIELVNVCGDAVLIAEDTAYKIRDILDGLRISS